MNPYVLRVGRTPERAGPRDHPKRRCGHKLAAEAVENARQDRPQPPRAALRYRFQPAAIMPHPADAGPKRQESPLKKRRRRSRLTFLPRTVPERPRRYFGAGRPDRAEQT